MSQSAKNTGLNNHFIDANVLVEIVLDRVRNKSARDFLDETKGTFYISTLTGHLVTHFGAKRVELSVLRQFLADYSMIILELVDFDWAFTNIRDNDFEDALQLGVAIRYGCNTFTTFDKDLHKHYSDLPSIQVNLLR